MFGLLLKWLVNMCVFYYVDILSIESAREDAVYYIRAFCTLKVKVLSVRVSYCYI